MLDLSKINIGPQKKIIKKNHKKKKEKKHQLKKNINVCCFRELYDSTCANDIRRYHLSLALHVG